MLTEKGCNNISRVTLFQKDLVPRILSSTYFHHYRKFQPLLASTETRTNGLSLSKHEEGVEKSGSEKPKENEGEQLIMGLCPAQSSFWRLSRLVLLASMRSQFNKYRAKQVDPVASSVIDSSVTSSIEDVVDEPQSLEIQEGSCWVLENVYL